MHPRSPRARARTFRAAPAARRASSASRALLLGAAVWAALPAPAAHAQPAVQADTRIYRIPPGPLAAALARFGQASGAMIAYSATEVAGRASPGLDGRYTVGGGLSALLAGSGMEAVRQENGGYALRHVGAAPAISQLAPLTVIAPQDAAPAPYAGGQVASGARVGLLGNKDFMDTPFSTVSYTSEYIRDRQAQDISSVIAATDPSVYSSGSSGTISENYSIRGFNVSTSDVAFGGLYGLVPYWRATPELAERIEVLKGPSALLNGMPPGGSVGGSINLVPKRAGDDPLARVSATYASDSQFGTHLDLGRRFGEGKAFGIRVNGVYRDGDSAVRDQGKKTRLGAVALDYRGERVRLSADVYTSEDHVDGLNRGISLARGVAVPTPPDSRTLLAPDWTFTNTRDRAVALRGEVDITRDVSAYAAYGHGKTDFDALASSTYTVVNAAADYDNNFAHQRIQVDKDTAEAGVRARFRTGAVGHELALTGTLYHHDYRFGFLRNMLAQNWRTNLYDPVWGPALDRSFSGTALPRTAALRTTSYGIADTLSFAGDRAQLTLGVRRQKVVSDTFDAVSGERTARYDAGATTPAVALLVKATDRISLYGNYIEGLSQGTSAPASAQNAGEVFPPYRTKQQELGAKFEAGSYALSLSAFQIKRPSSYTDPSTNVFSFGGEQRNRGLEFGFFGEALPGLRLMGGVAYTKAELTRTAGGLNQGKLATNLPRWQAKLGVDWDVPGVPGLSLNGNVVSVSRIYINAENTLAVPGRTVLDLGARYRTELAARPLVLRATVQNVTDKAYWAGSLTNGLGAPRTFLLSATMDF